MNEMYLSVLLFFVLVVAFFWINRPRGIVKQSANEGLFYFHSGPYSFSFHEVHWSKDDNALYFVNNEKITGKVKLGMSRGASVVAYIEGKTGLEVYIV